MKKGKKNKARGLIIGGCVLIALVVVLLIVQNRAKAYDEAENKVDTLFDETADKIQTISYTSKENGTAVTIERREIEVPVSTAESVESGAESDASDPVTASASASENSAAESAASSVQTTTQMTWIDPSDTERTLDQTTCSTLASSLTGVSVTQKLEDVSDPGEYGFDDPSYTVEITFTDGSTKKITIGDTNSVSGTVYCCLDDDTSTVYAVSTSITTNLGKTIDDLTSTSAADSDS